MRHPWIGKDSLLLYGKIVLDRNLGIFNESESKALSFFQFSKRTLLDPKDEFSSRLHSN